MAEFTLSKRLPDCDVAVEAAMAAIAVRIAIMAASTGNAQSSGQRIRKLTKSVREKATTPTAYQRAPSDEGMLLLRSERS